jgi:phosphatidylglycerophosphate synthase
MVESMVTSHAPGLSTRTYPKQHDAAASGVRVVGRLRSEALAAWQADLASVLGAVLCLAAGICLAVGVPIAVAAILFPLGGACDVVDGAIARRVRTARQPQVGAFVDSICDKVGEVGLLIGIVAAADGNPVALLAALAFGIGWLASYTKAAAGEHGLDISWPEVRWFGRAGRVILLSATLIVAALFESGRQEIFTVGLGALIAFNCVSWLWRLGRVSYRCRI